MGLYGQKKQYSQLPENVGNNDKEKLVYDNSMSSGEKFSRNAEQ